MDCCCYLRNVPDLLADGKTPHERRFGEPFKCNVIPFGAMVEYHSISSRDRSRLHQFGKKVLRGMFLGYVLYASGLWKGSKTLRNWKILDASEIHAPRFNAKDIITPKNGENVILPVADGTVKLSGRGHGIRKSTSMRDELVRSEELCGDLRGCSDKSQPTDEMTDDREARNDFWSIEGNHIHRRHVEARVQLYVPKKETFPIPLRNIDVVRSAHSTLDVLQESRVDDCWNIDANRNLSESWTRFTQTTILNEKLPVVWSWGRLAKDQATSRRDRLWPECQKQLNGRKSNNGLSRNGSPTMRENREASMLSIQKTRSSRKPTI